MADNLKLQQDINKAIAERNKMLAEGEAAIQRQAKLYATLLDVMAGKKGSEAIDQMIQKMESAKTSMQQMAQGAQEATEKTSKSFNVTEKDIDRLFGSSKSLSTHMSSKFPKAFVVAAAAVSGFKQGIQNVLAVGKSLLSLTEGVVGGLFNITKSILSIPFKMFDGLIEKAQAGGGGNELAQAFEDVRKEFGSFKQDVAKNVIESARSMKGELSNTGLSVWRVFGNLAERLKYVTELAKGMGPTFHTLGTEIAKNAENIGAYQKGLGLSAEEMGGVGARAMTMGTTLTDQLQDIANMSLQMGEAFGLSSKMISRDVGKMMKDVKNFGSLTVKEMTEATVYFKKLGIETSKVLGLIDKFDTFEGAAESAAKLSQAFGVNVNAFEMMKAQSPAERLEELRKGFQLAGKSADNLSRQERKLLADATGLDEETASLALSSKNMGLSLDEIKKKGDAASKKQLTQTEVMGKLADAIERLVQSGGPQGFKGFFDAFLKGIGAGITSSPAFIKLMQDIRNALMRTFQIGRELGTWLVKYFPGVTDIFENLSAVVKKVPAFFSQLSKELKKLFSGEIKMDEFFDNMRKNAEQWVGGASSPFSKVLDGAKKFFTKLSDLVGQGIKWVIPKLTEGLKSLAEFIRNPKKFIDSASTGTKAGSTFMMDILKPLIDAVNDPKMWEDLWESFKDFSGEFWNLLWNKAVKPLLKSVPGWFWAGVAGIMFGPAVAQSLLGAGVNMLGSVIKDMFVKSAEKVVVEKAAEKALQKGTESILKKGTEAAAEGAGPAVSQGLWSKLIPFITTVPSGAAAAGAAAIGAAIAAIAAAAVAAYTIWEAVDMQEKAVKDYTSGMSQITNALSKQAPIEEKKRALALRDAQIKAQEDALKDKKSGVLSGALDSFREAWEIALNDTHTTTEDMIAKMRRDRDDLNAQITKINEETAKKAENDAAKKRILDAMGPVTPENAATRFKQLDDLAKKVMSKDFDIAGKMKMIQDKLSGIDFSLFKDKTKEDQINQSLHTLESVKALVGIISDIGILSQKAAESLTKMSSLSGTLTGFSNIVASIVPIIDTSVKTNVAKLAASSSVVSKDAEKISSLNDAIKSLLDLNSTLKSAQTSLIPKEQQAALTTSILAMINSSNIVLGDLNSLNAISSAQVTKIKTTKEMFAEIQELGKSAAEIAKIQNTGNLPIAINSIKTAATTVSELGNLQIDDAKLAKIKVAKQMFSEVSEIQGSAEKIVKAVSTGGIEKSFKAIVDMVKKVQEMNDAVTSMTNKPMEIKARLQELATKLGLGAQQTYQIKNNGIEIKLNLNVTMDAGKVEEVIVRRSDSKIRKAFGDTGLKDTQSLNSHLGTPY